MKIGIVGGGPSGLYLALLLKRRKPELQVTVFEQNRAEDTFGFGVVMADTGLSSLEAADKISHDALRDDMHFAHQQTICLNDQRLDIKRPGAGGGAITRLKLLHILHRQCQDVNVDMRFSSRLDMANGGLQAIYDESDLVVGADGVSSIVRSQMTEAFGTTFRQLHNRFAWYGTTCLFANPALVFREHEGGHFIAHYYRYSDTMSTFVAECDEATWFHCGLDKMSDDERQALFERLFAPELQGLPLVASNSVWRQFPVIRNQHWHSGKTVLIGDALSSAHFSIGSGTRIAMEDSIALAQAIVAHLDDVSAIGPAYEAARRPGKDKLIGASEKSFDWYEDISRHMDSDNIYEFVYSFMTRTGRIDLDRLRAQFPELVAAIEAGRLAKAS